MINDELPAYPTLGGTVDRFPCRFFAVLLLLLSSRRFSGSQDTLASRYKTGSLGHNGNKTLIYNPPNCLVVAAIAVYGRFRFYTSLLSGAFPIVFLLVLLSL